MQTIAALREAQNGESPVRNPGGWLHTAIVGGFRPNASRLSQVYPIPNDIPGDRRQLALELAGQQLSLTRLVSLDPSILPPTLPSPAVVPCLADDRKQGMSRNGTKSDVQRRAISLNDDRPGLPTDCDVGKELSMLEQPEPLDCSDLLTAIRAAFLRLGWDKVQQGQFLAQHYGRNATDWLTDSQLQNCAAWLGRKLPG